MKIHDPRLYCLMRTDMASMVPGKAMAQAMHAQAVADETIKLYTSKDIKRAWKIWKGDRAFGTTIVLNAYSAANIDNELIMN